MLKTRIAIVVGVLTLTLAPALAWAAEHGQDEPSLFAGDLVVAICTLVIFGLVLVVLTKFAWAPMIRALQNRETFIRESLASAKRDRQAAEARLAEYEKKLAGARDEAIGLVDEGRRDAEGVRRRIEDEARRSAEAMVERARRDIGVARDTALRELHEQSTHLAMSMARAVLKRQLSPEDHQRLLHDALAELREQSAGRN